MFKDSLFKKIENKTSINKETIISLSEKLKNNNLNNETAIREVIRDLSKLTKKEVSKEKEDKIVNAILNNKVPQNIDKMF